MMKRLGSARPRAALLVAVGWLALGGTSARAGFTVSLDNGAPTGSGPFTYSYTATITSNDVINPGDFFRINDIGGYVSGSVAMPAGWQVTVADTNVTPPPNVIPTHGDDPALPNFTFTYEGSTPIAGAAALHGFSIQSVDPFATTVKDFVGRATNASGGTHVDSVGDVLVPAVPEPSALLSCSIGAFVLLGFVARSWRRA